MIRANIELAGALLAAIGLVIFLAWYQGQRASAAMPAPLSGQVMRISQDTTAAALAATKTAAASAPAVAPRLPTEVLERDRAFINQAFPVLSSWSVSDVKPLLSNAALRASTDAELTQVMTTLNARLGTLQSFDAPQPVSLPAALADAGTGASLQPYAFTAYYEAGEAEVNLVLEKRQQQSSLYSFDIHIPN